MTCAYETPHSLFEADSVPEVLERWLGPSGNTLLSWEVDFSDGGASRLHLRSAEGEGYWVEGARLEIVEPERIVFSGTLAVAGERPGETPETVTFRRS